MAVRIDKGRALAGINMTPMIDCVFLLLIFFLVATKFEEAEREMSVVLPQASEAMPLMSKPNELFVNVDHEGRTYLHGRLMQPAELLHTLQQAWANNPGRQSVIIRADERCAWRYVVAVMDACNKANIRDYRVTVLDPSGT
jgi:biopolymer transport protein ExbD